MAFKRQCFSLGDCVWSGWLETDCSATCGNSTKIRRRYERIPADPEEGGTCDNVTQEIETCDTNICKSWGKFGFVYRFHST